MCLLQADEGAHLLEYASGADLIAWVQRGDDVRATYIIADVLNRLHSQPLPPHVDTLIPLSTRFRALFQKAEASEKDENRPLFDRAAALAKALLAQPQAVRVLHGDVHHGNIRHHPRRGWLAFDPKGLIGERTFDAANVLCNPLDMAEVVLSEAHFLERTRILADELHVEQLRLIAFVYVYACLSFRWSLEDGIEGSQTLGVARLAERYLP